jgi:hypothetical protein
LVIASAAGGAIAAPSEVPVSVTLAAFSCQSGPFAPSLPKTLPSLLKIGTLKSDTKGEVHDWDTYRATERTLKFEGLTLAVVDFSNNPDRYLLGSLASSSSKWKLTPAFQVGGLAQQPLRAVGAPTDFKEGVLRVVGETDSVSLVVQSGRIMRVTYECYTG